MRQLAAFFIVLGLGAGCSAPPPPPPEPQSSPLADLGPLEPPVALRVGQPFALTLKVIGDSTGRSVQVHARPPGPRLASTDAVFSDGSSQHATGTPGYLQSDFSVGAAPFAFLVAPTEGAQLQLKLPAAGEWALTVELADGNGKVEALRSFTLLVSDVPALVLSLSRRVAGAKATVRGEVTVTAGAQSQAVKVFAWLQDSAGKVQVLPNLGPGAQLIHQGALEDRRFTVLNRPLPVGLWQVHALMFDAADTLLAFGSAGIQICDADGMATGRATEGGSPISGAEGEVHFTELIDGLEWVVPLASDGTWQAALPAGRYLATAAVQRRGTGVTAFAVGCAASVSVNIEMPAALPGPQPLSGESTRQALASNPDNINIFVFEGLVGAALPQPTYDLLWDDLVSELLPAFETYTSRAIQTVVGYDSLIQGVGGVDNGAVLAAMGVPIDFHVQLIAGPLDAKHVLLTLKVTDPREPKPPVFVTQRLSTLDGDMLLDLVESMARELRTTPVMNKLLERQDLPRVPQLTLNAPDQVTAGTTFPVAALLSDKNVHHGFANKKVKLSAQVVGQTGQPLEAITDDKGVATWNLPTLSTPYELRLVATYTRFHGNVETAEKHVSVVAAPNGVRVDADKPLLSAGETANLTVRVDEPPAAPMADPVDIVATGGSLDTARATTDLAGVAAAQFTADGTVAAPIVGVTALGRTANAQLLVRPACNNGVCPDLGPDTPTRLILTADPTDLVTNGTSVFVVADLRVARNQFAGLPVRFTVTGLGTVDAAPVETDASGVARIRYFAPMTGSGTDTIKASVRVAGALVTQTIDLHYQPACASCPVVITGPDFVKKGAIASYTANLPVSWSLTGGFASLLSGGKIKAGTTGGKVTLTATTTDSPVRTGSIDVWVTCTPDEVLGNYTTMITWDLDVATFDSGCPRPASGSMAVATYPTFGPNQLQFSLLWPKPGGGTCGYNPSQPLFVTLGDKCDLAYQADANVSSNNCHYLRYFLQKTGTHQLTGRMDVDDLQNGCVPVLGAKLDAR